MGTEGQYRRLFTEMVVTAGGWADLGPTVGQNSGESGKNLTPPHSTPAKAALTHSQFCIRTRERTLVFKDNFAGVGRAANK